MSRLYGITYSLPENEIIYFVWSKLFCKKGWHLFDEVLSSECGHYLYCDACGLSVMIKGGDE